MKNILGKIALATVALLFGALSAAKGALICDEVVKEAEEMRKQKNIEQNEEESE